MEEAVDITRDLGDVPVFVRRALTSWIEGEYSLRGTPATVVLGTLKITCRITPLATTSGDPK